MHYKKNGGAHASVEELLSWEETYPIQWREPKFDIAELARLRFIEGLSTKELAQRFGKTECAIKNYYRKLKS